MTTKLDASIPANNWKIIELYNKLKKGELDAAPNFQRKLVWKKLHKYKFIETIRLNFPFPEVYIAQGSIDIEKMHAIDMIVDGQQRCTTIENYIDGVDVFAVPDPDYFTPFKALPSEEKTAFLNYEVSIRYLKNASAEQISEIFQRINSTDYALNDTERTNAQWGDSDFIYFAKQIIEQRLERRNFGNYEITPDNREFFLNFFYEKYSVFSTNYVNRMLALQYILTLLATLIEEGKYFKRNDRVQVYIEKYNEEFTGASNLEVNLIRVLRFIDALNLPKRSYWFNKANLFTLIVELYSYDLNSIDTDILTAELINLDVISRIHSSRKPEYAEMKEEITPEQTQYFVFAREAVNEQNAREYRGNFVKQIIQKALKK